MNKEDLVKRRHPRLKHYDYSQNGCYFVTICTKDKACILCKIGAGQDVEMSDLGQIVDLHIKGLTSHYSDIDIPKYVIMPNHIHLLIFKKFAESGGMSSLAERGVSSSPTLQTIIRSFKTYITRKIGFSIWQDSYYEHIVRNEEDYLRIWQYLDDNPVKWAEDKYYTD